MFTPMLLTQVGVTNLLDQPTIQLLLSGATLLVGYLTLRNRSKINSMNRETLEAKQRVEDSSSANKRQDSLLSLLSGIVNENTKQSETMKKQYEASISSNERWMVSVDGNTTALKDVATGMKDLRDFGMTQHQQTRNQIDTSSKSVESKLDSVRMEVAAIRQELNAKLDDIPSLIEHKFKAVDDQLTALLLEVHVEVHE